MKNTNIDWCPQIPSEWTEVRIKDVALLKSGDTFNPNSLMDGDKYQVYGGNGVRGFTNLFNNIGKHVIIGRQGALCGNINYADGNFFATEHAIVVYPYIIKEPIHWLGETLRSANYNRLSTAAAQPGLAVSVLSNQFIPYPPYIERVTIANYLDTKCCKIDASIATLKEMKDKYLSLKKSLINETVCRGLNKNVPLKSSGIDWIGDIPEHWEVTFLKHVSTIETGKTPATSYAEYFEPEEIDWFTPCDFNEDSIILKKSSRKISFLAIEENVSHLYPSHTVYINGIGSIGKVGFYGKPASCNQQINAIVCNKIDSKFLSYYLLAIKNGIASLANFTTLPILNQTKTNYIPVIVPPISEQQSIAKYLDDKCSKIDSIVANIDSQIEAYTKLKKSLISEVVTGKKRVI